MKLYIILCFIMILINEILGRVKVCSKNKLKKQNKNVNINMYEMLN